MSRACPEYRVRLFLSVDLVGSTAFKAQNGAPGKSSPNPAWVDHIRRFYRSFPDMLSEAYRRLQDDGWCKQARGPQVWKTIGDEIAFCCKVESVEHLVTSVRAFVTAPDRYGRYLESQRTALDVKGYGWVAAFPFPNVTVQVFNPDEVDAGDGTEDAQLPDEALELEADESPARFDFLGREIDAGFRSGRYCAADKLTMSVELAWLLTSFGDEAPIKDIAYTYDGRKEMKGVLSGRPYPIIAIDVERDSKRRHVRDRERALTGGVDVKHLAVKDFIVAFVDQESIDVPQLIRFSGNKPQGLPHEYIQYVERWKANDVELTKRAETELEAAESDPVDDAGNDIDTTLKSWEQLIAELGLDIDASATPKTSKTKSTTRTVIHDAIQNMIHSTRRDRPK